MDVTTRYLGFTKPEWFLVCITVFWGGTFLMVKNAMTVSGPMFFVGLRFAAAAVTMALLSIRVLRGITWHEVRAGFLIGVCIAGGYGLQTVGLQTILSSKSAFITAMYVPFVPLLQWLVLRRRPGALALLGCALAFAGMVALAGPQGSSLQWSLGEAFTLLSAMAIAGEIILISRFAGTVNTRRVTVVQLVTASVIAFAAMLPAGESVPPPSWLLLVTAVGLGLTTALIQFAMNWAQRTVAPLRATLIYAGEPVWAGVVGRIAGERLGVAGLVGGVLILAGVIVSGLRPPGPRPPAPPGQPPGEEKRLCG